MTLYVCSAGPECLAVIDGVHRRSTSTGWQGTAEEFGVRRDGRRNTRCPTCRARLAALAAHQHHTRRVQQRETRRDLKALRVVERWCGFSYAATRGWTTPDAVRWQRRRGISLQDVWTERMRRLAARADRCEAARRRIAARVGYGSAA